MSQDFGQRTKKIYFYTGSFTHTFYREIFRYPPKGFAFVASSNELTGNGVKRDIAQAKHWSNKYRLWARRLAVSILAAVRLPKVGLIKHPDCDLIHSAQYPLLNKTSWVVDFEDASVFTWYRRDVLDSPVVKRIIEGRFASPSCKAILPWTQAARESLENAFNCQKFKDKITVVYPVMTPKDNVEELIARRAKAKKIKILFVGTTFYAKGAVESLIVLDGLSRRYSIECVFVTRAPEEYKKRYAGNSSIIFAQGISQEELRHHYETSHLFIAPYHNDTFGFVILEAFSYGIPCVATDQFAIPEIVTDGKTGLVVKNSISRFDEKKLPTTSSNLGDDQLMLRKLQSPAKDYLSRLGAAVETLISDRSKLTDFSRNAYQEVVNGRFSPKAREAALLPIYTRATQ